MGKRCPTCKQEFPNTNAVSRRCFQCGEPIRKHDKWCVIKIDWQGQITTSMMHRHCDNPESYTPKEKENG